MTTLPKNMRRIALIPGSVLIAGSLVTVLTSAAQAPARPAAAAAPSFVLKGSAVGGVQVIQTGQVLTFDFTATNKGSKVDGEDLVLERLTNVTRAGVPLCVDADGAGINPDGSRCEPGTIRHGQSASFVITTKVTGKSRHVATARLCLQSETTGVVGPCLVVPVGIA
jgi:hypothetical protein